MKNIFNSFSIKKISIITLTLILVLIFSFNLIGAEDESGKINLTKTATKIYEKFGEDNLSKGRFAKVDLTVEGNSYSDEYRTLSKLDIVLVLDNSGSMAYTANGKTTNTDSRRRLYSLKATARDFINNLIADNDDTVRIGLVSYETKVDTPLALTSTKTDLLNYIDNMDASGGTNIHAGILKADELLDSAREDAKQIVIILTDGIPTFYLYDATIRCERGYCYTVQAVSVVCGAGNDDDSSDYSKYLANGTSNTSYRCSDSLPSTEAKNALDSLKTSHSIADVYTITFGNESEAASILATINPASAADSNVVYKNYTALTGDDLKSTFEEIKEQAIELIGEDSYVIDVIPPEFSLTEYSKRQLEDSGIIIAESDEGTTLTWNIGNIEAGKPLTLSYEVLASDDYYGSIYTNKSAILNTTIKDNNPYYCPSEGECDTDLSIEFDKPIVEVPVFINSDSYTEISSYEGYSQSSINGVSILDNDLIDSPKNDGGVELSNKIIIVENENTINISKNVYEIYKENVKQGVLTLNDDGTFSFISEENISGEISFEYYIETTINPYQEINKVNSNSATVTLNILPREQINIIGKKIWEDNNNQDGIRPSEITINLLANDNKIADLTVTSLNNWGFAFNNLYRYQIGHENDGDYEIQYTVTEDEIEGYETTIDGYNVTNTHEVEKKEITVTKTWEDNNNQDGIRPSEITVRLLANNKEIKNVKISATTNWTYRFTELDVNENGNEIVYTIKEDEIEGYETIINGFNITNTHETDKTSITVRKNWIDDDNRDNIRPEEVIINLHADNEKVDQVSLNEENNWTYTFTNLEKNMDGTIIDYTVSETEVEGYTTEITGSMENGYVVLNTHEVEKTEVTVSKTWIDDNNRDGIRKEEVIINLHADNKKVDEISLNEENNWTYTFNNLNKYNKGIVINYTVSENEVEGYTTEITGSMENGYVVLNTHEIETISLNGIKTWQDNNNQDGIRPNSITLILKGTISVEEDIEVYNETKNITASVEENEWSYDFDNLPKYANEGYEIQYSLIEEAVDGYEGNIDGMNITNTHIPETINITGEKIWVDENDFDGLRPESITVNLYKQLEEKIFVESKKVSKPDGDVVNSWTYTFENLDKYQNKGEEIVYIVEEVITEELEGLYTSSYDIDNKFNIINTHDVNSITVKGNKVWNHEGNRYELPNTITVNLSGKIGDNEILNDSIVLNTDETTMFEFTNLPQYVNGMLVTYTISEDEIFDYSTSIETMTSNEEYTYEYLITNTYTPITTTLEGIKTWSDNDDQDGIRPNEITINLLANGEIIETVKTNEENNWTYKFENQVVYANGEEIVYTVEEVGIDGYTTLIDNFNITNTHNPVTISYNISKIWNDDNNNDGIRPNKITVRLFADGEEILVQEISEENNWTYVFKDLPKYKDHGTLINYVIVEDEVKGYITNIESSITENNENVTNVIITNSHANEVTDIKVNKIWEDLNNQQNKRPQDITVNLYADEKLVETVKVTEENDWKYTFENLNKYSNGKVINYTITENEVENYETKYDGYDIINYYKAQGSVTPPPTGIIVKEEEKAIIKGDKTNDLYLIMMIGLGLTLEVIRRKSFI